MAAFARRAGDPRRRVDPRWSRLTGLSSSFLAFLPRGLNGFRSPLLPSLPGRRQQEWHFASLHTRGLKQTRRVGVLLLFSVLFSPVFLLAHLEGANDWCVFN